MFARFEIVAFNSLDFLLSFRLHNRERAICPKVAKISVFNKFFGSVGCFKPYFSISTSSSVNLQLDKFFVVVVFSSVVNSICVFLVKFSNFFLCVEITLLTAFPTLCLIHFFNIYRSTGGNFIVKVCKIFACFFCNFFSSSWRLFLLRINFESTLFVYGRLKLKNFGITLNILQLHKKFYI